MFNGKFNLVGDAKTLIANISFIGNLRNPMSA